MKSKILAIILSGVFVLSLTACGDSAVESVLDDLDDFGSGGEEYVVEVPASILNLSEEDDILLCGELKDGVYTNNYFGYKCKAPAGSTLAFDTDDEDDSSEGISMKKAYEDGWGGISLSADLEMGTRFGISITPLNEDEIGLSEEELVKKHIQDIKDFSAALGDEDDEDGPEYETILLAGEEHPVSVTRTETEEDGLKIYESFYIPKGDFLFGISLFGTEEQVEEYIKCFEKN